MSKERVVLNLKIAIVNKNYSASINDYRVGGMKWNDVGSEKNSLFYKIGLNKEDLLFALGVNKQLSDLKHQLALTEKALELACERLKHLYCCDCGRNCDDLFMNEEDIKRECKLYCKCWNKECILEQVKEMMKSE